jgi:hypothetical protein
VLLDTAARHQLRDVTDVSQPFPCRFLLGAVFPAVALLLGACGDHGTGVEVPDLQVITSTTGTDLDPDGYSLSVDGDPGRAVGVTDTLQVTGLGEGDHEVSLGGVIENCAVQGDNPRSVHIVSGGTSETNFLVVCGPLGGTVTVTTVTTGEEPDADGYGVTVDDGAAVPAAVNDTITISGLADGSHQVALTGIAVNCRLQQDNPQTVTVAAGESVTVVFTLRCPVAAVSRWTPMTSGTRFSLVDVWGASGSDAFIVGQSDNTFESTILHYDGSAWSSQLERQDIVLNAVWGSSGSDVYAVGFDAFALNSQLILHFDGERWRDMNGPPANPDFPVFFESVWGSSASDVFIVGSFFTDPDLVGSVLVHCDGTECAFMGTPQVDFLTLEDVWGSSPTDVYAVGNVNSPDLEGGIGTIIHYDGQAWTKVFERDGVQFTSVSGSGSGDVVAVGADGVIVRYDGTRWRSEQGGSGRLLFGAWSHSPADAFAVAEAGRILHSAGPGKRWTSTSVRADNLFAVWGSSGTDVFAVGEGGKIFHGTP